MYISKREELACYIIQSVENDLCLMVQIARDRQVKQTILTCNSSRRCWTWSSGPLNSCRPLRNTDNSRTASSRGWHMEWNFSFFLRPGQKMTGTALREIMYTGCNCIDLKKVIALKNISTHLSTLIESMPEKSGNAHHYLPCITNSMIWISR